MRFKPTPFFYQTICLFFISVLTLTVYGQNNGRIVGEVKSGDGGHPVSNVDIILLDSNRGGSTDEKGRFEIDNLPKGYYQIKASTVGFETDAQDVEVSEDPAKVEFVLKPSTTSLEAITIKGENLKDKNRASTVNSISTDEIKKAYVSNPQDLLHEVPGVERINLGQGGTVSQIGIRGFETGGHGGDIAMEVDGVSFNETEHSGGYVDMNIIIPLNLSKMDVYKGPSSPLFGLFARGGAFSFETRKGGDYQDLSLTTGSY